MIDRIEQLIACRTPEFGSVRDIQATKGVDVNKELVSIVQVYNASARGSF